MRCSPRPRRAPAWSAGGLARAHAASRRARRGWSRSGRWSRSSRRPRRRAWQLPDQHEPADRAEHRLARVIAERIKRWLTDETPLAATGRPIRAGDVMILLPRRGVLQDLLVRAAQAAARAGRGRRPAGPDRRDRGHGPGGAGRRAAAARGRPDARRRCSRARCSGSARTSCSSSPTIAAAPACASACGRWRGARADFAEAYERLPSCWRRADFLPPFELYAACSARAAARERFVARLGPRRSSRSRRFSPRRSPTSGAIRRRCRVSCTGCGPTRTELIRDPTGRATRCGC